MATTFRGAERNFFRGGANILGRLEVGGFHDTNNRYCLQNSFFILVIMINISLMLDLGIDLEYDSLNVLLLSLKL